MPGEGLGTKASSKCGQVKECLLKAIDLRREDSARRSSTSAPRLLFHGEMTLPRVYPASICVFPLVVVATVIAGCGGADEPPAICGDGVVEGEEACDDGNNTTEECDYDSPCTVCSAECREVAGAVATCGDGVVDEEEECDDGNTITDLCDYEGEPCTVCADNCTEVEGVVPYCGDAMVNGPEGCDEGVFNSDEESVFACRSTCTRDEGECGTAGIVYDVAGDFSYEIPADGTLRLMAWGGGGGGGGDYVDDYGHGGHGGGGGYAETTIDVTAGETLYITVANGGVLAERSLDRAGGGQMTRVVDDLNQELVVAGGGGGGGGGDRSETGAAGAGGNGGAGCGENGSDGLASVDAIGGMGATPQQVGTGASGTYGGSDGDETSGGIGGRCADIAETGGNGGDGYFGGGGGAAACANGGGGGGGGSCFAAGEDGVTAVGSGPLPGNADDPQRCDAGTGGVGAGYETSDATNGNPGRVVIVPVF